ncbi:hypothetical protein C8F01DRAFT_736997 [Mycena amicta]|nr:hypothetical protein C8F01DRAFT_736997 [Mycena amicta]
MSSSPSSSTTSLLSDTTVSSRTPIVQKSESKDFSDAFASLQSTYGFGSVAPSPSPIARSPKSTVANKNKTANPSSPSPSPSAVQPSKDYEAAFADLQSSFGFGASIGPILPPVPRRTTPKPTRSTVTASPPAIDATPVSKDYGAAFADLQSSFGFAGGAPCPVSKSKSKQRSSSSSALFSKLFRPASR